MNANRMYTHISTYDSHTSLLPFSLHIQQVLSLIRELAEFENALHEQIIPLVCHTTSHYIHTQCMQEYDTMQHQIFNTNYLCLSTYCYCC
jgi:hypothetical protein